MKLAYCLANFFIADAITQTNVHTHSRSISEQSVSENNYDYNTGTKNNEEIHEQIVRNTGAIKP
ncbi:hypothetical protein [Kluyvera sp. Awk 3]|uniref:hypothetical protein n=1 Tax=Kluyvera sp. Awk 3 TaxID=2963956 RepID=UPI002302F41D|nr:hypothetical protein [Kluyvera sp. Awk 3]